MEDEAGIARLHHIGIVVADLDRAMREMTDLLGIRWTDPQERPDGDRVLRVAFSRTEPRIELIQGNAGGVWDNSGGPRLDHMAFFTGSFETLNARADGMGLQREAGGTAKWGGRWSYVRTSDTGSRIEICDERGRAYFERQWGFEPETLP